ncbi:MAG TPA: hypothetical protein VIE68_01075 [Gemmatimonadota bacterium]|jgi:hypothetical protein
MTFIDWSDSEEMLGLLSEYVADARNEASEDGSRSAFLGALLDDLTRLTRLSDGISLKEAIVRLRGIHESHSDDLEGDPVLLHVADCIDELERIRAEGGV